MKKKRRKKRSPVGYIILILVLLTLIALLVFEHFHPIKKIPAGTWIREVDLTSDAAGRIGGWLATGGTDTVNVPEYTAGKLTVSVRLIISEDGSYEQSVDEASYQQAKDNAYDAFASMLKELIGARFSAIGLADEGGLPDEEISPLMNTAVGMDTREYLMKVVPDIIPEYEELAGNYERSGICRMEDGLLIFEDGSVSEVLYDEDTLVLDDVIYARAGDEK